MGRKFRHYKGADYECVAEAIIEATGEPVVVYRALDGDKQVWVRPASEFFGTVDVEGRTIDRFAELKSGNGSGFAKVRQKYPNAFRPWTVGDDEELERLYCERQAIEAIASHFGRGVGAIEARIEKLELMDKYPQ